MPPSAPRPGPTTCRATSSRSARRPGWRRRSPGSPRRADPSARRDGRARGAPRRQREAALLVAVDEPGEAEHQHEHAEHDDAEVARDVAEHRAEGVAEEVADEDERRRPDRRGDAVEEAEALPGETGKAQAK